MSSGGAPTLVGTSVFNFLHTNKCKVKHNGIWGWGIYSLNGWGRYGKISFCFQEICSRLSSFG